MPQIRNNRKLPGTADASSPNGVVCAIGCGAALLVSCVILASCSPRFGLVQSTQ